MDLLGKTAVSYFPRPLQTSFLMCGAVLCSFSYWGVSYLVAQIELCFFLQFSYFSGTGALHILKKIVLTSGPPTVLLKDADVVARRNTPDSLINGDDKPR